MRRREHLVAIIQKIIEKFFDTILLFVSILFLSVGIYAIVDNRIIINEADIPEDFKQSAMADREYPDIRELQKTNRDLVAWLTLDDTKVDYPIAQTKDNSKYLTIDYAGNHSISGTPFVDYRNTFLNDDYTIIYGHRMNQQKMFGSIVEYADASYMQKHLRGTITTTEGTMELEVIAYSVEDLSKTILYDLSNNKNNHNSSILESISKTALTINGKYSRDYLRSEKTSKWKLLLLSTCDKDSRHYRDVLLLRIGEEL